MIILKTSVMILCKPLQHDIFTACHHDMKKGNFLQNHIISLLVSQNISHLVHLKSYYFSCIWNHIATHSHPLTSDLSRKCAHVTEKRFKAERKAAHPPTNCRDRHKIQMQIQIHTETQIQKKRKPKEKLHIRQQIAEIEIKYKGKNKYTQKHKYK